MSGRRRHSSEPVKSSSHLSRVRTMLSYSPLGRRRHSSSGSITNSNESPLTSPLASPVGRVWGLSLDILVQQNKPKQVPFIVEKIIQHVEQYGLDQEGLYRVNGNARTIEKLKASFDKVGDADFSDADVAAVGGLLKLFLRDMPAPLITENVVAQFVELHENFKSYTGQRYYEQIRNLVKQLPVHHYQLLQYLVRHLVCVAKHEDKNKMSPVSLSIVFGPNIFRCDGGLTGLQKQGVCNSFLSKMIIKCDQVFMQDDEVWIAQVKEEAQRRREKPQKPMPYSVYMENLTSLEELNDEESKPHDVLSASWGHSISPTHHTNSSTASPTHQVKSNTTSPTHHVKSNTTSPTHHVNNSTTSLTHCDNSNTTHIAKISPMHVIKGSNERNIDDWVTASYPGGSHALLNRSHDSDPDLGSGQFVREVGIRRRSSIDGVRRKTSLSPPREEELPRTPSPWSQFSNSSVSPSSSPVQGSIQVMSQFLNTVIEQTVRELLFGPSGSRGTSTPAQQVSIARQRRRTKGGTSMISDATNTDKTTIEEIAARDVTSTVTSHGGNVTDGGKPRPVILRRGSSKEEKEKKKMNRESGALFPEQFKVASSHSSVDEIDGVEESEEVTSKLKHHKKRKPAVKGFDLFESSGLIMGAPIIAKPTPVLPGNQEHHHFVMTSSESHDEEDTLSQSTGLYDVKMVKSSLQPVAPGDLDVVKSAETLSHPTLGRPRPPANRRSPGRRGRGTDTSSNNSVPDKKHIVLSSSDELIKNSVTHVVPSVSLHSSSDDTLQTLVSDSFPTDAKSSDSLQTIPTVAKSGEKVQTKPNKISTDLHNKTIDLHTKLSSDPHTKTSSHLNTKPSSELHAQTSSKRHTKASSDHHSKASNNPHTKTSSELQTKTLDTKISSDLHTKTSDTKTSSDLHTKTSDTKTSSDLHTKTSDTKTSSDLHTKTSGDVCSKTNDTTAGRCTQSKSHDTGSSSHLSKLHSAGSPTHYSKSHSASNPIHTTSPEDQQKRLNELKTAVRRFEAEYMAQHGGNKPSGADKDPIRPMMREYFTIKRQLQSSSKVLSKTAPAKLITKGELDDHKDVHKDGQTVHADVHKDVQTDKLTPLERCQKLLADHRRKAGRPDSLDHMNLEQLREEKLSVQKTLIQFESEHGRPQTEEGKEMMRPLYDYYRQLKKLLGSGRSSTGSKSQGADLGLTTVSLVAAQDTSGVSLIPPDTSSYATTSPPHTGETVSSGESHEQIKEQLDSALAEKRNLKQLIHKFEVDFLEKHGRAVTEKEDRQPVQQHYNAYKKIKAHIKLLETLLAKKDSNITV